MPSTLKRSRRKDLTLTRSFVSVVRSKVHTADLDIKSRQSTTSQSSFLSAEPDHVRHPHFLHRGSHCSFQRGHFIHNLPPEVLAHIFVLGSLDDPMLPVTISHVCSTWRNLALHTPTLWRRVSLNSHMEMWRERVYRAKACSFDIELKPDRTKPRALDVNNVIWYMHLVIPHINRWRSLDISFTHYAPFLWNAALSGCCGNTPTVHAPLIEEISLVYHRNDDTKEFLLFDGVAPRLRRLTVAGLRLTWLPSLFENLTYLDYTHHSFTRGSDAIAELLSMLETSRRIQELKLLLPSRGTDYPILGPPHACKRLFLPSLLHLQLRVDGWDIPPELHHFVALTSMPSLVSLQLLDAHNSLRPFGHLGTFLRLFPLPTSLVALRIENGWYDPRVVSSLLTALSGIRQLIIKDPQVPERLFVDTSGKRGEKTLPETLRAKRR